MLATLLVVGVFFLRGVYNRGEPTPGQVVQEVVGYVLVMLGVIGLIGSVLGR
jgi:hypothetical protein